MFNRCLKTTYFHNENNFKKPEFIMSMGLALSSVVPNIIKDISTQKAWLLHITAPFLTIPMEHTFSVGTRRGNPDEPEVELSSNKEHSKHFHLLKNGLIMLRRFR